MDSVKSKKEVKVEKRPIGRPKKVVVMNEIVPREPILKRREPKKGHMFIDDLEILIDDFIPMKRPLLDIPAGTEFNAGGDSRYLLIKRNGYYHLKYGKEFKQETSQYSGSSVSVSFISGSWKPITNVELIENLVKTYSNVISPLSMKYNTQSTQVNLNFNEGGTVILFPGGTGNCQLTVVGCMDHLVNTSTNVEQQLINIAKFAQRKLILCDVKDDIVNRLKKKLSKVVIQSVTPYISTNGSSMNIVMLNLKGLT